MRSVVIVVLLSFDSVCKMLLVVREQNSWFVKVNLHTFLAPLMARSCQLRSMLCFGLLISLFQCLLRPERGFFGLFCFKLSIREVRIQLPSVCSDVLCAPAPSLKAVGCRYMFSGGFVWTHSTYRRRYQSTQLWKRDSLGESQE